jgi:hypothetical protein
MPLYTLITRDGALSSGAKVKLAMDLTTLHSECAGVPHRCAVRPRQLALCIRSMVVGGRPPRDRKSYVTWFGRVNAPNWP